MKAMTLAALAGVAIMATVALRPPVAAQAQSQLSNCLTGSQIWAADQSSKAEQTIKSCTALLETNGFPVPLLLFKARGFAYSVKGEYDRAITDYDQAIKLDAGFSAAYNGRGMAYRAKEDLDRTMADYDQAIKLAPDMSVAYGNRGEFILAQGGI